MLSESEQRAAQLAVSRYGADRAGVQQAVQTVLQARAQGKTADFFDHLVRLQLLSAAQAQDLRMALDLTQVDPGSPKNQEKAVAATNGVSLAEGAELRSLGEYRILRRLGAGGMGAVYLGYQEAQGRQVALKVLAPQLAASQTSLDRFGREARNGALLNHPNIVRNWASGQDQATGFHYMVLEYVDGPSAQALLESHGPLAVSDAVYLILDIARALEHLHSRNIIHRDIKPGNILITLSGVAKLADLGLAKRTDETSHLTAARQGFGTPFYMPYEQTLNAKKADGRSDIFALGATLYHLVTGTVPFPGSNHLEIVDKKNLGQFPLASSLNPDIPPALDRILNKMLSRQPDDRYQTASELIVDLERSKLAAAVPSFVDPDRALQDPLVRRRLTMPAQPTCPALDYYPAGQAPTPPAAAAAIGQRPAAQRPAVSQADSPAPTAAGQTDQPGRTLIWVLWALAAGVVLLLATVVLRLLVFPE